MAPQLVVMSRVLDGLNRLYHPTGPRGCTIGVMFNKIGLFSILVCLPACLLADFSYEQSSKMTGGSMMAVMKIAGAFSKQAREPIQTTVSVKGNRIVHWSKDHSTVIYLDTESKTDLYYINT